MLMRGGFTSSRNPMASKLVNTLTPLDVSNSTFSSPSTTACLDMVAWSFRELASPRSLFKLRGSLIDVGGL
jgi:hypothetical protein